MKKNQIISLVRKWVNTPSNTDWIEHWKHWCNITGNENPEPYAYDRELSFLQAMRGRLWHLTKSDEPEIALLGKGVVFDGGGHNAKTYDDDVQDMFCDMAGAAVAAGVYRLLPKKLKVVLVCPMAHNVVNDTSLLPGGVYRSLDGPTVEVIDTDSEGRLLLADAIQWVQKVYPSVHLIVCVGTFAGSSDMGPDWGLYTVDYVNTEPHTWKTPEQFIELPLDNGASETLKTKRADISNYSSSSSARFGSHSIIASFLRYFVTGRCDFAYFDIAGPTLDSNRMATGFGVETLERFIKSYCNNR